ncbi:hypothetical protein VPH35_009771 [Triticum aestivum]
MHYLEESSGQLVAARSRSYGPACAAGATWSGRFPESTPLDARSVLIYSFTAHLSRRAIALAALDSYLRAVPPEAVAAVVDLVFASSPSSTSPSKLFRTLLFSFPKV